MGKLLLDDRWLNRKRTWDWGEYTREGGELYIGEGRKLWLGIIEERWD